MIDLGIFAKRLGFAGVALLSAVGLTGCFDLEQRVGLHSDGSGSYAVVVTADGVVGEGLAKSKGDSDIDLGDERAVKRVTRKGDKTVQTSEIGFKDVSELKLGDETIALHVKGRKDDGETEVNFHRSFRVDHARQERDKDKDEAMGREVLQSMFGGHTYKFAVWLPGEIERVAPIRVAGRTVRPMVWNDRYGHTLVWQMALPDMFMADRLDFDVDFAAKGNFHDSQSRPGEHHMHRHRHHDDDDDDNDD